MDEYNAKIRFLNRQIIAQNRIQQQSLRMSMQKSDLNSVDQLYSDLEELQQLQEESTQNIKKYLHLQQNYPSMLNKVHPQEREYSKYQSLSDYQLMDNLYYGAKSQSSVKSFDSHPSTSRGL